ncbi:hypothetical protein V8E51_008258 [Hyaloscypha variabilis]
MISMKNGELRLAVPTTEYAKMVQNIEREVEFEEAMCGKMSYSQRHSRIETLLEFAVWKHVWNNHPKDSSDHAPMFTRSWKNHNHPIEIVPLLPRLAPTSPPRMGNVHYNLRPRIVDHHSTPDLFPPSQPRPRQDYTHSSQSHGIPATNQLSLYARSGVAYPQVPNTPGFNPSSQPRELFPSLPQPPIGTGRPSSYPEGHQSLTDSNIISITSHSLQTPGTYTNPFAESEKPYLEDKNRRKRRNSATASNRIEMNPQRRPSTSAQAREKFPIQAIARDLVRHGVPIRNDLSSRRSSISTRRSTLAESHDHQKKSTDTSSPHGVLKRRRDSLPRRAAANARAAIARCSQVSKEVKSEYPSPTTREPTRSWAQVAAGEIEKEPSEDQSVVQDIAGEATVPVKKEESVPSNQTWAQVAAAEWLGNKTKQHRQRIPSFGKPSYNFERYRLELKGDNVKVKVEEGSHQDLGGEPSSIPVKPKAMRLKQKIQTDHRAQGRAMFRRTVPAGL